jgi:hypothetical protein
MGCNSSRQDASFASKQKVLPYLRADLPIILTIERTQQTNLKTWGKLFEQYKQLTPLSTVKSPHKNLTSVIPYYKK